MIFKKNVRVTLGSNSGSDGEMALVMNLQVDFIAINASSRTSDETSQHASPNLISNR
jgi:hypothetical protein